MDLLYMASTASLNGGSTMNDCWGWTDPLDSSEYALVGCRTGTAFLDITDPVNPVFLGNLPSHTFASTWRDIKVYADHAFIVSEASGHGMQVFDLKRLRNVPNPPETFTEDAHYGSFGNAHNIAINEASGKAYVVGSNSSGAPVTNGGLLILDISAPLAPTLIGTYTNSGYIHDTHCVLYHGPDPDHQGLEICINSHSGTPDRKTIVDVTDPSDVNLISEITWPGARIGHQGWLTEDHQFFLLGDEGDENFAGHNTRTYVFDVTDLDNPVLVGWHDGLNASIDHNLYTHKGLVWEANYTSGLQVLDPVDLNTDSLRQVAFFDSYPANDNVGFSGAWSNYPYFPSGNIIISDYSNGFFIVRPTPSLQLRVFLDGPLDTATMLMDDALRANGFIPLTEPYTALGYAFVHGGGELINASVTNTTGPDAIVDWVVVELRSVEDSTEVVESRSALLQRDGDIVDLDGISALRFNAAIGSYYVSVLHRNHLGIMSGSPLLLSLTSERYDLTDGSVSLFGTMPVRQYGQAQAMWPGDCTMDGIAKYIGGGNDRDAILVSIGGSIPTNSLGGYSLEDVNMYGLKKYTGAGNDRDVILISIGGSVPTATRSEQLP
jgi:choice-of-anchor B domain-containing protein